MTENFSAYSILNHRHVPEVLQTSGLEESGVQLHRAIDSDRPRHPRNHLLPHGEATVTRREILGDLRDSSTRTSRSCGSTRPATCPICTPCGTPISATSAWLPIPATGRCVVVSAIDNLVKGAAGQAIQNLNLALGLRRNGGPAVKALIKIGGSLLDDPASRARHRAPDRAARRVRRARHGGARRRQADDPLPRRARHREPLSCAGCASPPKRRLMPC